MSDEVEFRHLTRDELDTVLDWAAAEGWNPGLDDGAAFWAADPEGFYGFDVDDELAGAASLVVYGPEYGFAGLFILAPEHRGHGAGDALAHFVMQQGHKRMNADGTVAMDGVFRMQDYYATLGFSLDHRNLRMGGVAEAPDDSPTPPTGTHLIALDALPFDAVTEYDARHFGARREDFLRHWIAPKGGLGVAIVNESGADPAAYSSEAIRGIGVVRPCQEGFKVGPLFADGAEIAEVIFATLGNHAAGSPIFLDVPECNPNALALAARYDLAEVFGCARMHTGPGVDVPWQQVYGVTTFELG